MAMVYKMLEDGQGIAVNDKGLPIVYDNEKENSEMGLDAIHLYGKVPSLQNEVKQLKGNLSDVSERMAYFEGVEDLADYRKRADAALTTVQNIEDKKLIDAGEVETIKRQAQESMQNKLDEQKTSFTEQVTSLQDKLTTKDNQIFQLMVSDRFNTSKFVKDELAMTNSVARKYFGDQFKVEEENGELIVVGYHANERIYSQEKPGELATFDEALKYMVERDPDKNHLLASGAQGGGGYQGSEDKTTPNEIEKLRQQYEEAKKEGNIPLAVSLKNQLFAKGVVMV